MLTHVLNLFQAVQIYSTLGMTNIDDLVNNIFSVFDRLDMSIKAGKLKSLFQVQSC